MSTTHPTTIDELLEELASHPVNTNQFFIDFRDQFLLSNQLFTFITQYHFFCYRFVKVLEGLLYHTPLEELEMRVELTKTLYSELGGGSVHHAHIRHLERFAQSAGVDQHHFLHTQPIPEVQGYLDILHQLFTQSGYLQALGAELAVEITAVSEFEYFLPGLQKYSQFSQKDLLFFSMHLEEEVSHGNWLVNAVKKTARSQNDLETIAQGARQTVEAWHAFWQGMHRAVFATLN